MLWILLVFFWTYLLPRSEDRDKNLITLPLSFNNGVQHDLTCKYTSQQLRSIGANMDRLLPPYQAIRKIKELKINKRRVRLQKITKTEERLINFKNLASIPPDGNQPILYQNKFSFGLVNIRSIKTKINLILSMFIREKLDFLAITETWLRDTDSDWLNSQLLNSLSLSADHVDRPGDRRGGGLLLMTKKSLQVERIEIPNSASMECAFWKINMSKINLHILLIYHPPDQHNALFTEDLLNLVEGLAVKYCNIMLMGDFNLHISDPTDAEAQYLLDALLALGLHQHVNFATHNMGNILDLIFTEESDKLQLLNCTPGEFLSDHCCVLGQLNIKREVHKRMELTVRKFAPDYERIAEMEYNNEKVLNTNEISKAVACFEDELTRVFDIIKPAHTKLISKHPKMPWYNKYVFDQKQIVRNREKIWRKYKQDHQWTAFKVERNRYKNLINFSKSAHISGLVVSAKNDVKRLYLILNTITGGSKENPFPENISDQNLSEDFADFFLSKIEKIREKFTDKPALNLPDREAPRLTKFSTLTAKQVTEVINSMKTKSCEMDPVPTTLLKELLHIWIPSITHIVNLSLDRGEFSEHWKCAIVRPLLKKKGLELNLKNYRPVSNLKFISKVVEKAVLVQFLDHCQHFDLLPDYQSAYRKDASCETAVLKLCNEILWSMEKQEILACVLLDLSAAFDTVDHEQLLRVLQLSYGISDSALHWYNTYLRPRSFKVCVNQAYSSERELSFSVPQGSSSGANIFTAYCQSIISEIPAGVTLQGFADDHFAHKRFKASSRDQETSTITTLESTMLNIKNWMDSARLKMNPDKTEFIMFGHPRQLAKTTTKQIEVCGDPITLSSNVRCLGAHLDSALSLKTHISNKCKSAMLNIKKIKCVRHHLNREACEIIVNGLVLSHLDYCNAILCGLPDVSINKMQRVQNIAAKLILKRHWSESSKLVIHELHWLSIRYRIVFKVLCIVHKCIFGNAPMYLKNLLTRNPGSGRTLRSSTNSDNLLIIPRTVRKTFADRSFSVFGPRNWNSLPNDLRLIENYQLFKKKLKTHLFVKQKVEFEL